MNKEKEEMLEKLREVKKTAEEDLSKTERNNSEVVQNVKYLGIVELRRRGEEETDSFELCTVELYDYDSDEIKTKIYLDGKEADVMELQRTYEDIMPIQDTINKAKENQEKDLDENKQYDLNQLEQEKAREYANTVGKEDEKITEVDELDLNQKLEEDSEKENDISEDVANSLSRKEETSLDQEIKGTTLRNALGLSDEYVKIAIVSSSQVNKYTNPEKKHSNKESFVAIKENGEATVLGEDIIEQDRQEGKNSAETDLTVNLDGRVSYEQSTSSYRIKNSPNLYLKVGYDESFGREIKIEDRSKVRSKDGIVYELETSNTWKADDDVIRMQKEEGIYAPDEAISKQEQHEKEGCKNDRVENIDNYEENDTHEHDINWKELATKWGYYRDGKPDEEKAKEVYEEHRYNNPELSHEEVIQKVSDELYEQLPGRDNR